MPQEVPTCSVDQAPAPHGAGMLVRIDGEFDLAAADPVSDRLRHLCETGVPTTIDLRPMRFVDSYGACTLLRAANRGRASGWDLGIIPPTGHARRVLALCEIDRVLPLVSAG